MKPKKVHDLEMAKIREMSLVISYMATKECTPSEASASMDSIKSRYETLINQAWRDHWLSCLDACIVHSQIHCCHGNYDGEKQHPRCHLAGERGVHYATGNYYDREK